ncbi:MAG: hypothetical protein ACRDY0_06860 [Acidimicrobiales bacterium]
MPTTINADGPVPAVITVAYVNAVLAQLDQIYGDATRLLVSTRALSPVVAADLRATFNDPAFGAAVNTFIELASKPFHNFRPNFGNRQTTVLQLITDTNVCIFAQIETDYSNVDVTTVPDAGTEFLTLRPKQAGADPIFLNKTPWAISNDVSYQTHTEEADQCSS